MLRNWRVLSKNKTVDNVWVSSEPLPDLANRPELIDRTHIIRTADSIVAGSLSAEEGMNNVIELTKAQVQDKLIVPLIKQLKAVRQKAIELLRVKKAQRKALKKQLGIMSPKFMRTVKEEPEDKKPWGLLEIIICIVFTLFSIGMMAWAVVNTRNMAVSSFPIFAANPELAWGVGGVIALLALFLEMIPDFFGLKGVLKKFYHGSVGAITAVAAVAWVGLFAKSAGFLGHGAGMSVDLESMLAPEGTFLGLTPEQQDLLLTSSQFCLEFLLPALGLAYVYQIVKSHGQSPPPVRVEENPDYQHLVREIEQLSAEIGDLKNQIKCAARFEASVDDIIKQYVLKAKSLLLECCGQVQG